MPYLTVIIPTRCDRDQIFETLRALSTQSLKSQEWELILISNGSSVCPSIREVAKSILQDFPATWSFQHLPQAGVNQARNYGAKLAHSSLLLFLDDDCQPPDSHYLERVLQCHKTHSDILAVGGYYYNSNRSLWLDRWYNQMCNTWLNYYKLGRHTGQLLLGGSFSISKTIFDKVSMNEQQGFGADETRFFLELRTLSGRLLLTDDHSVIHSPHKTLKEIVLSAIRQGQGRRATAAVDQLPTNSNVFCTILDPRTWPFWAGLIFYYALVRISEFWEGSISRYDRGSFTEDAGPESLSNKDRAVRIVRG